MNSVHFFLPAARQALARQLLQPATPTVFPSYTVPYNPVQGLANIAQNAPYDNGALGRYLLNNGADDSTS